MQKSNRSRGIVVAYSSFIALAASFVMGGMLLSPSEPGSAVFVGLSLPRLVLASGLFAILLFFSFLSIKALSDRAWAETTFERWFGNTPLSGVILWSAAIGFLIGWIGCFLPAYRAGILSIH